MTRPLLAAAIRAASERSPSPVELFEVGYVATAIDGYSTESGTAADLTVP